MAHDLQFDQWLKREMIPEMLVVVLFLDEESLSCLQWRKSSLEWHLDSEGKY